MNATEQKDILALLRAADVSGAIRYVEAARKPRKPRKSKKPMRVKRTRSVVDRFLPASTPLEVAPCRCTVYRDQAVQCREHEEARDPSVCLALVEAHQSAIEEHQRALGFKRTTKNWPAFVYQHSAHYKGCPTYA